jgi:hypothetical protein
MLSEQGLLTWGTPDDFLFFVDLDLALPEARALNLPFLP